MSKQQFATRGAYVPLTKEEIEVWRRFIQQSWAGMSGQGNTLCDMALQSLTYGSAISEIVENHDIRLEQIALTLEGCVEMKPEMFKSVARELRTLKGTIPSATPQKIDYTNDPQTPAGHKQRHVELHRAVDELFADYIRHHPSQHSFLEMPLKDFIEWSHSQTIIPTEGE